MKIEVPIVNAFIDEDAGGNPAGVVLNAEQFSQIQKHRIAAAVGLSETAFVSSSSSADFKLEFFTPTRQIAHCGHATIAAFSYLQQIGLLSKDETSKETIDGRREILMEDDHAYMEQKAPQYTALSQETRRELIDSLGLDSSYILNGMEPCIVNTGNAFMVIALNNENSVNAVEPNMKAISAISQKHGLIGYYVFTQQTKGENRDAGTRMFAPLYGIDEESATGMAAGPLACYLYDRIDVRKSAYIIEQGHFMNPASPSVIKVRLKIKNGIITSLMAGGKAKVSKVQTLEI